MFGVELSSDTATGTEIKNWNVETVDRAVRDFTAGYPERAHIVVAVGDFEERDPNYVRLKYGCLRAGVPVQVVKPGTVMDPPKSKWAAADIGLGIFAKLGGQPWSVESTRPPGLIVGVGQAHEKDVQTGRTTRHFAFNVLTDSTGRFLSVAPTAEGGTWNKYLSDLQSGVLKVLENADDVYDYIAIHTPFTLRRDEVEALRNAISGAAQSRASTAFVGVKFNQRTDRFGVDTSSNSAVPPEGTVVRLSRDERLVWFDGTRPGEALRRRIENPVGSSLLFRSRRESGGAEATCTGRRSESRRRKLEGICFDEAPDLRYVRVSGSQVP